MAVSGQGIGGTGDEAARNFGGFRARLAAIRGPLLVLAIVVSAALAVAAGWTWFKAARANASIQSLLNGENVEIDATRASPKLAFARAYYLLKRDRVDEAQAVIDQANWRADPATRVDMLYDMANTRLRASFDAIEQGKFDKATALIGLAKDEYTAALRVDPEAWAAKFNLDVAARLLRDLPLGQPPEDEPRESPQQLWTDLPGVPKGEP